jgi:hypothetical protein
MLPDTINAMKIITYDVKNIVESLTENDEQPREVDLEEVMEVVRAWAIDDFGDNWNVFYQTDDGDEL